jgi:hypothetical protein
MNDRERCLLPDLPPIADAFDLARRRFGVEVLACRLGVRAADERTA